ncbi:hypothetical protein COU78_05820 [Candidatus Peregrinibacteria bacterium CG10_big_fil_rev_8_21_14_0_10_49_24]|nr:MAG: hypothetical protein COV83_04525 [Candidatus Peregrinibacteria bacterium CG11_big_fil_rev_8_21_14_0_20_49_14]PIR50538.1 MAG: hypothetical protein COU78_05820 [Candidatus Peregrinibacteria bacterium CG10_big_fil_rev_8_21_14_0_10_49_24]PJA67907.1 MAG: hypothetical protein CO157_01985 [Candidatus Peregrinibacteria bacterium CG_4_9_14_3_um_filter_49_12]
MSNTQNHTALSVVNAGLVIAGMIMLSESARGILQADTLIPLNSQGAVVQGERYVTGESMITQGTFHAAAPAIPHMGPELAIGMLLVLLGCSLHALLVVQNQKPLGTNLKHKVDSRELGGIRRYMEVFWIDLHK